MPVSGSRLITLTVRQSEPPLDSWYETCLPSSEKLAPKSATVPSLERVFGSISNVASECGVSRVGTENRLAWLASPGL